MSLSSLFATPAVLLILLRVLILPASAQTFTYAQDCLTNVDNATVVVPTTADPTLPTGDQIEPQDTVAVYTEKGRCAGFGVWEGTDALALAAAGPNTIDTTASGYASGETLKFEVYDVSAGTVVDLDSSVTYQSCTDGGVPICRDDGRYADGTYHEVISFSAGEDSTDTVSTVQIAGIVNYPAVDNQGTIVRRDSIEGATVVAIDGNGQQVASSQTDASGTYRLTVDEGGTYRVDATRFPGTPQGISVSDAVEVVRNIVGDVSFPSLQQEVADVNDSGSISIQDAVEIVRFIVGDINAFSAGSILEDPNPATVAAAGGNKTVNIRVAAFGDVNFSGQFSSSSSPVASVSVARTVNRGRAKSRGGAKSAKSGEAPIRVEPGATFEVPIRVSGSAALSGYQFSVDYPTEVAQFEGVQSPGADVLARSQNGTVRMAWFDQEGGSPLSVRGGEALVVLTFRAADQLDQDDTFQLENIRGELVGTDAKPLSGVGIEVPTLQLGRRPDQFALKHNAPNPFAGRTAIRLDMPESGTVTVEVYNTLGQQVSVLRQKLSPGVDRAIEVDGSRLASGAYFYRVRAELGSETVQKTGRMTVVK